MKLVIATVRREKANDVIRSLDRAGIHGYSITRAEGPGGEPEQIQMYRGSTIRQRHSERIRFEVAVPQPLLWRAVDAICAGARTGEVGDGDIVVLDVADHVRIGASEPGVHGASEATAVR
jgi:nitrogen regulatory protein P-II 1